MWLKGMENTLVNIDRCEVIWIRQDRTVEYKCEVMADNIVLHETYSLKEAIRYVNRIAMDIKAE